MEPPAGMQKCATCGEWHPLELLEPIFVWPDVVARIPKTSWPLRVKGNQDLCVLDDKRYFVRCVLPFKVEGREKNFCIGCWAEVSRTNFGTIKRLWSDLRQGAAPPFDATVSNALPHFPELLGLAVTLQLRSLKLRPALMVTDETSVFFADQQAGIDTHRVIELQGQPA